MFYKKEKISRFDVKPSTILTASDLKQPKYKVIYWIMFVLMILVCAVCLLPSVWIILSAFKDSQEISASASIIPKNLSPSHMAACVKDAWVKLQLGKYMISTILMSIGNLAFCLTVCGLGGYVLSRLKPVGTKVVFALVVWTMMLPAQMRTVPLYMEFIKFPIGGVNITNTYLPLWLIAAANCFDIMLFKNHFDSIPISLVEASKIDGCGDLGTFCRIMVPLSIPIFVFVGITCVNVVWSDFFWPMIILQKESLWTLPVLIYKMTTAVGGDVTLANKMMGLMIACVPPFILFVIFQKQIMGGVNVGGVKG